MCTYCSNVKIELIEKEIAKRGNTNFRFGPVIYVDNKWQCQCGKVFNTKRDETIKREVEGGIS